MLDFMFKPFTWFAEKWAEKAAVKAATSAAVHTAEDVSIKAAERVAAAQGIEIVSASVNGTAQIVTQTAAHGAEAAGVRAAGAAGATTIINGPININQAAVLDPLWKRALKKMGFWGLGLGALGTGGYAVTSQAINKAADQITQENNKPAAATGSFFDFDKISKLFGPASLVGALLLGAIGSFGGVAIAIPLAIVGAFASQWFVDNLSKTSEPAAAANTTPGKDTPTVNMPGQTPAPQQQLPVQTIPNSAEAKQFPGVDKIGMAGVSYSPGMAGSPTSIPLPVKDEAAKQTGPTV